MDPIPWTTWFPPVSLRDCFCGRRFRPFAASSWKPSSDTHRIDCHLGHCCIVVRCPMSHSAYGEGSGLTMKEAPMITLPEYTAKNLDVGPVCADVNSGLKLIGMPLVGND